MSNEPSGSSRHVRLQPETRSENGPQSTPLSIVDASVANYTPCCAAWIFPPPIASESVSTPSTVDSLIHALRVTLSAYPQWCGRLHLPKYDAQLARTDHTRRFGRPHLSWGVDDDPGVEVEILASSRKLPDISHGVDENSPLSQVMMDVPWELYPGFKSLVDLRDPSHPPKPCMCIKFVQFDDGSLAISLALHHCLADTQALMVFVHDWASAHRSIAAGSTPQMSERPFQPQVLDRYAEGDVDSPEEDEMLKQKALKLPQRRYDFWAAGKPPVMRAPTIPHPDIDALDQTSGRERGRKIHWDSWDYQAKTELKILHFTKEQIQRIWESAQARGSSDLEDRSRGRVSRLDALLAHLWRIINRARQVPSDTEVSLDMSVGLRTRLDPPLPSTLLGSPLANFSPVMTSSELDTLPLGDVALLIRETLICVDAKTVPSLLHHLAYALDPIREWNAFMGSRNVLVTSWLGTGAWNVDFGWGRAIDVGAGVPPFDGSLVIMDETPSDESESKTRWYEHGVRVRICLVEDVMRRVLDDPFLFGDVPAIS